MLVCWLYSLRFPPSHSLVLPKPSFHFIWSFLGLLSVAMRVCAWPIRDCLELGNNVFYVPSYELLHLVARYLRPHLQFRHMVSWALYWRLRPWEGLCHSSAGSLTFCMVIMCSYVPLSCYVTTFLVKLHDLILWLMHDYFIALAGRSHSGFLGFARSWQGKFTPPCNSLSSSFFFNTNCSRPFV